jgi:hypothetical protein
MYHQIGYDSIQNLDSQTTWLELTKHSHVCQANWTVHKSITVARSNRESDINFGSKQEQCLYLPRYQTM